MFNTSHWRIKIEKKKKKKKKFPYIFKVFCSGADPHRKNADADPGKNLNADADSCSY
jgi:hypothetical protein